ncbi:hypothetical protein [Xenorhabdus siamensis]|uniref:hypothetical protein n=1 Tax=Xenorhabdus siamensis TaxID=3136254 RepID=UPI0030F47A35
MTKHIHADLISEYARLAQITDKPWEHFEVRYLDRWIPMYSKETFLSSKKYRLKPSTIEIGKYDVPEPVREPLEECDEYYCPDINTFGTPDADSHCWGESIGNDMARLSSGLIHLDRESAELHAKALISLTAK